MSKALEKAAQFSPTELFLLSALAGGGAFGGMRLLSDMHNQVAPATPPDNSIKLQLPNPHKPHHETSIEGADPMMGTQLPALNKTATVPGATPAVTPAAGTPTLGNTWMPYVAMAAGLPAGFLGTKAVYDSYQQNEQEKQIAAAKQQYTQQLMMAQHAMSKSGSETPYVDSLCEAMAQELHKSAGLAGPASILGGAAAAGYGMTKLDPAGSILGGAPNVVPDLPGGSKEIMDLAPKDPDSLAGYDSQSRKLGLQGVGRVANAVTGGGAKAAVDAWKVMAGGAGIGLLGLLIHNHNKKKEREQKANYPTTVTYA